MTVLWPGASAHRPDRLIDDPLRLVHVGVALSAVSCDGNTSLRSNSVEAPSPVFVMMS